MRQRIITGMAAGAVYLTFLLIGSIPFALLVTLIAMISFSELASMKKLKRLSPVVLFGMAGVAAVVLLPAVFPQLRFAELFLICIVLVTLLLLVATVLSVNRFPFDLAAHLLLSFVYISFSFSLLVRLRLDSLVMILLVQLIIWSTDTGAYLTGRQWGRHKLAPHISPNKTREGFLGGIAAALVTAVLFQIICREPLFPSFIALVGITLLIAIAGQFGDLVESAVKRSFGVKDSGKILPGHGGLFDRFDSLIFVLPVLYLIGVIG